jgi:probable addiction module antidote protein
MKLTRSYHEDLLKRLADPKYAVMYLNTCLEDEDEGVFLLALHNVAQIHGGLAQLARKTRLNREHLFRMLSKKGNPGLHNLRLLVGALGYKITLRPA